MCVKEYTESVLSQVDWFNRMSLDELCFCTTTCKLTVVISQSFFFTQNSLQNKYINWSTSVTEISLDMDNQSEI